MSQKETILANLPDVYKTAVVLSREIGTFVVIVAAFAFGQWQNYQSMEYIRTDQKQYLETIVALKEQVAGMRLEISELKTNLRAYELRVYGQGAK